MKTTITLTEADIREIIRLYLYDRGHGLTDWQIYKDRDKEIYADIRINTSLEDLFEKRPRITID